MQEQSRGPSSRERQLDQISVSGGGCRGRKPTSGTTWERGRWAGVAQAVLLIPFMVTISIVVTLILHAKNSESFLLVYGILETLGTWVT